MTDMDLMIDNIADTYKMCNVQTINNNQLQVHTLI